MQVFSFCWFWKSGGMAKKKTLWQPRFQLFMYQASGATSAQVELNKKRESEVRSFIPCRHPPLVVQHYNLWLMSNAHRAFLQRSTSWLMFDEHWTRWRSWGRTWRNAESSTTPPWSAWRRSRQTQLLRWEQTWSHLFVWTNTMISPDVRANGSAEQDEGQVSWGYNLLHIFSWWPRITFFSLCLGVW